MSRIEKLLRQTWNRMDRIERRQFLLKDVFTYEDAALYLGCTLQHVKRLTAGRQPTITSYCPTGCKQPYIKRKDIDAYLLEYGRRIKRGIRN